MVKKRHLNPQSIWDREALLEEFERLEIKPLHINKIYKEIKKNPSLTWDDLYNKNIPKKCIEMLKKKFVKTTSKVVECSRSNDGNTSKLLIQLQDGIEVETVIIRHQDNRSKKKHKGRATACVSSQVGCKMGCTFCATGTMGLLGNLTSGEILEQFYHAKLEEGKSLRNVVFMGMGEPLDNWDNVKNSIHGFLDRTRFELGANHVTVSTVGVVSRMKDFTDEFPDVNLALSLHAPTQNSRLQIVPTSKAYTIEKLIGAIDYHNTQTNRQVLIEYICIGNVNCTTEIQHELGKLLKGKNVIINLIPYNPTEIGDEHNFESPTDEQLNSFKIIIRDYGLMCTIRKSTTSGQDIDGACGQLALKKKKKRKSHWDKVLLAGCVTVLAFSCFRYLKRNNTF